MEWGQWETRGGHNDWKRAEVCAVSIREQWQGSVRTHWRQSGIGRRVSSHCSERCDKFVVKTSPLRKSSKVGFRGCLLRVKVHSWWIWPMSFENNALIQDAPVARSRSVWTYRQQPAFDHQRETLNVEKLLVLWQAFLESWGPSDLLEANDTSVDCFLVNDSVFPDS